MLCEKTIFNRKKHDAYWCHLEGYYKCNKFKITTKKIEVHSNYVMTSLQVTDGTKASLNVMHFAFTVWPESDLPISVNDFLDFILTVRRNHEEVRTKLTEEGYKFGNPPIVVHCNAGINRSGLFILRS